MGFDLSGLNPKNTKGEYFRNNCWWWRRLANFVLEYIELPKEETQFWDSNDGQKVSERSAIKIAKFLRQAIKEKEKYKGWITETERIYAEESKRVALAFRGEAARKDKDFGKCHHPFTWTNVKEFAEFCENSGGFEIW